METGCPRRGQSEGWGVGLPNVALKSTVYMNHVVVTVFMYVLLAYKMTLLY